MCRTGRTPAEARGGASWPSRRPDCSSGEGPLRWIVTSVRRGAHWQLPPVGLDASTLALPRQSLYDDVMNSTPQRGHARRPRRAARPRRQPDAGRADLRDAPRRPRARTSSRSSRRPASTTAATASGPCGSPVRRPRSSASTATSAASSSTSSSRPAWPRCLELVRAATCSSRTTGSAPRSVSASAGSSSARVNPRLVYAQISGYGEARPAARPARPGPPPPGPVGLDVGGRRAPTTRPDPARSGRPTS